MSPCEASRPCEASSTVSSTPCPVIAMMTDLQDPSIHPPVPKEDIPVPHAPARQSGPAAREGSSTGAGCLGGANPFAAFTEWAGDNDAADYADL